MVELVYLGLGVLTAIWMYCSNNIMGPAGPASTTMTIIGWPVFIIVWFYNKALDEVL